MKMKNLLMGLLAGCILLSGCGSAANSNGAAYVAMDDVAPMAASESYAEEEWDYDEYNYDYDVSMEEGSAVTGVTFAQNKKIIYKSNVVLETMTYNETYERLLELINKYNGYIEYENYDNQLRSFLKDNSGKGKLVISTNNLTIRIPSKNYSVFMQEGLSLGNVLNRNQTIEDKTSEYNTNKSYVDILNDEAEYLAKQLDVLESELKEAQANDKHYDEIIENMKDIAERKAQVEKELVPYKRVMDDIDEKVEYSTITMELREVNEYTIIEEEIVEETFGSQVKKSWNNAMKTTVNVFKSIVLFLIDSIPVIVVLIIIAVIVVLVVKLVKKSKFRQNLLAKNEAIIQKYSNTQNKPQGNSPNGLQNGAPGNSTNGLQNGAPGRPINNVQGMQPTNTQGKPMANSQGKPMANAQGKPMANVQEQTTPLSQIKPLSQIDREPVRPITSSVKTDEAPKKTSKPATPKKTSKPAAPKKTEDTSKDNK